MAGNLNLVNLIQENLTGDFTSKAASFLGESGDKTRSGINVAIPLVLFGLSRAASNPDGARRITSAIDDADDGILNNLMGMFGKGYSSDLGSGLLTSILGASGLSSLSGDLGRTSGLSARSAASLIGLLAPIIFGALRKARRTIGSDRFDIASFLASQKANIEAAMPEGVVEETAPVGARGRDTAAYAETRTEHRGTHWAAWLLPLALLAGAFGLIWNWASRPRGTALVPSTTVHADREAGVPRAATLSLDALKAKYRSVLDVAQAQGVRISDLREQNGRLVLRGVAPSQVAANHVWEEIKRVNPSLDDITAELRVEAPPLETAPLETIPAVPDITTRSGVEDQTYTVKRGDTLSSISQQFYGDRSEYVRILDANRDKIHNKNLISVGQELMIPEK